MSPAPTMTAEEAKALCDAEAKRTGAGYEWTYTEEPHATRRVEILKKHPEIKELFGPHPDSKWYCAATVFLQILCAYLCSRPSCPWWAFALCAYVVGGTANHSLTLAIHEMSHHLFFKKPSDNRYYAMFANWPLLVPYSVSFKKYHLEHHKFQGVDGVDTDIPTAMEGFFFTTPFRKLMWVFLQPFFYAIRPLYVCPKPFNTDDFVNILSQGIFLTAMYKWCGIWSILYFGFSTLHGLGLHPCAGHFIAEHYTNIWSKGKDGHRTAMTPLEKGGKELYPDETFTYRGPLNMVSYNVGIHVAHHDFPYVSGLRLKEVEKLAPEFYEHLPVTESWPGTIYKYIFSDCTPFDRVKRKEAVPKKTN